LIANDFLLAIFIASFGLMIGSFLNALVWRLRNNLPIGGKERSICTKCKHQLVWYDLIPVISWLSLKAKCRYCQKPISAQYPVVELLNSAVWLVSFIVLQPSTMTDYVLLAIWLFASSCLLALATYDAKWLELPDNLVLAFTIATIGYILVDSFVLGGFSIIASSLLGVFAVAGLFYGLHAISDGAWIGGGDVKLAVGMGILLGLEQGLLAVFVAAFAGSIFGLAGIAFFGKNRSAQIPFGPFLIMATIISFLFGEHLIDLYMNLIII
jgi:prepilin signal peptidase PulO-like enzyme (type II secretory pathway)